MSSPLTGGERLKLRLHVYPIWRIVRLASIASLLLYAPSGCKRPERKTVSRSTVASRPVTRTPKRTPKRESVHPTITHGFVLSQYDQCASVMTKPRMARWRPLVRKNVGKDKRAFALLMTFIFVESGGNQFAVSRSGCAGLMQFCDSTALRAPFGEIFDVDRLRPCNCVHRKCRVKRAVRRLLETSERSLHPVFAEDFPCDLSDARFDPERAIRAGWTYIKSLSDAFDGNFYLTYIGYNSGPAVARRIWSQLGRKRAKRLSAIGKILRAELEPTFGPKRARRRARSLINTHLPKVEKIYRRFLEWTD
jgi:hypothetical protein